MSKEAMKLALEALEQTYTGNYKRKAFEAIKALEEALAKQEQLCRSDGRCQYAIDSGAEGMGHCPKGKCVMPAKQEQGEPVAFDVWLQECESMTMAVRHGVKFLLMPEESAVRIGIAIQNTTPRGCNDKG